MGLHFKLILPLLDDKLTLEDISPKAGFINIYSYDINKPYLDNHVFLLYSNEIVTKESFNCQKKLKSLSSLHSYRNLIISGHSFTVYNFVIINKSIRNIKDNCEILSNKEKMRILAFWKLQDIKVNDYILEGLKTNSFEFIEHILPEEDYVPSYTAVYDEKSGALQYRSTPL